MHLEDADGKCMKISVNGEEKKMDSIKSNVAFSLNKIQVSA